MKGTRRNFISGMAAGAAVAAGRTVYGFETPLLKVGVTTDTHFGRVDVKGVERCEKAWKLFKRHGCGLIANCGDIANTFLPECYEEVCRMRKRVFGDMKTAPREVWVYAGHDRINMPGDSDKKSLGNYALLKKSLQIPHEAYDCFSMAGFEFLTVPHCADFKRYERMLSEACAKTPGRPVFVFDHHPGRWTTEGSLQGGDERRTELLSKFPQAVHVTGHAHGSLYNEQNIHQGGFTSVSAACLTYFTGTFTGMFPSVEQNRSVLVMELFADYAVIRRYSVETGEEIGADEPWTIRWPYDPKKPHYSHGNMRALHPAASFPEGSVLSVVPEVMRGKYFNSRGSKLKLEFPETGSRFTWYYRVEAYRQDPATLRPVRILQRDVRGEYFREPKERTGKVRDVLDAAYFKSGEKIAIRVTPCDFWGGEGRPLTWRGTAPDDVCDLVFRGEVEKDTFRLPALPPEADGRDLKVVVDAEVRQSGSVPVCMGVKACDFWWAGRVATPLGHSKLTYIFSISKAQSDKRYEFSFSGGEKPWTVEFTNLRVLAMR